MASVVTAAVGIGVAGAYALTMPGGSGSSDEPTATHRPACVPSGGQSAGSRPPGFFTVKEEPPLTDQLSVANSVGVSVNGPEMDDAGRDWQHADITLGDVRLTVQGELEAGRLKLGGEAFKGHKVTFGFTVPSSVMASMNWARPPNAFDPSSIPNGGTVTMDQTTYSGLGLTGSYRKLRASVDRTQGLTMSTAVTRLPGNKVQVLAGPKRFVEKAFSLGFGDDQFNISLFDSSEVSELRMEQAEFDLGNATGREAYYKMAFAGEVPGRDGGGVGDRATVVGTEAAKTSGIQVQLAELTFGSINNWGHTDHLITKYADGRQDEEVTYREFNNTMAEKTEYAARDISAGRPVRSPPTSYQLRLRDVDDKEVAAYNADYANRRGIAIGGDQNFILNLTHGDFDVLREQALEILAYRIRWDRYGGWNKYPEFRDQRHVSATDVRDWITRMLAAGGNEQEKLEGLRIDNAITPYWVYIAPSDAAILSQILHGPSSSPRDSLLWLREWAGAVAPATGKDPVGVGTGFCRNAASNADAAPVANTRPCQEVWDGGPPPSVKAPRTVRLPDRTFLSPGSAVSATVDNLGKPYFVIGQQRSTCRVSRGGDGGTYLAAVSPDQRSGVVATLSAGGGDNAEIYGCKYIDQAHAAITKSDVEHSLTNHLGCVNRPKDEQVEQLPTGVRNVYAALVHTPRNTQYPQWNTLGSPGRSITPGGSIEYLYVSTLKTFNGDEVPFGQSIGCSLPDDQDDICAATLSYFLIQAGKNAGGTVPQGRLEKTADAWVEQHRY